MAQGIDSISLNPDTVVETWQRLAGSTGTASLRERIEAHG